uniref:Uncharacterized protein n=1 Tax=Kalanchoe fedtschenkoi TaxID=63787 RepID=A0A7N0V816_KALFE
MVSCHLVYWFCNSSAAGIRSTRMFATCGFQAASPGYEDRIQPRALLLPLSRLSNSIFITGAKVAFVSKPLPGCCLRCGFAAPFGSISASSVPRGHSEMRFGNEFLEEPSMAEEFFRGIKSLFSFLVDQPRQLRYIEWPTFSSTFKTATLTLVLVALLIVALATVDSNLCYLLALFLRRKP